jgi:glutamate N-acetyltransferase/amino-acid N-acetyltransferase
MRYRDRPDLGLIVADRPCGSAGVFTRNTCAAAPVVWSRQVTDARAILVNAGQANAQTGERGRADCAASAEAAGKLAGVPAGRVLLASTGIIGQRMNMPAMLAALPALAGSLSEDGLDGFSRAILTTDTRPKAFRTETDLGARGRFTLWGCVKGAGMIAPDMATLLAFVLTDVPAESGYLKSVLGKAAELSFNRITVDGDTSTNDTLLALSSSAGGGAPLASSASPGADRFEEALFRLMESLARSVVEDAEGATKTVTVAVRGAETPGQALAAARTVACSPLVKTAFFGEDANWGRILCALGRSGAAFDPYRVDLYLDGVHWVKDGVDNGREEDAQKVMKLASYTLTADLNRGSHDAAVLTCDLSHEYVTINGSYRS